MNLVVLTKSTPAHMFGGVETHAELLARAAARLGHDVCVVTTAHPSGIAKETWGEASVLYLDDVPAGVHSRVWWARSAAAVARRHAQVPIDLVLSLGLSGYGLAVANLPVRHYGVAYGDSMAHVISEWHDRAGVARYPRRALGALYVGWLERRMWRRANGVVATDKRLLGKLRRLGHRATLSYTGIDVADFVANPELRRATRAELGIPPEARVVLMLGTVNRQKGMWLAAEIFPALARHRPGVHLLIVGDGPDLSTIRHQLAASAAAGIAHFTGTVPLARIPAYYAASDVFFFPTLRVEGLPFAVIYALAAGLPTVAADRGGIASAIEHEITGLLAPAGDRAALRDALARILDDARLAVSLGKRARDRAVEQFDVDVTTARLLEDLAPGRR